MVFSNGLEHLDRLLQKSLRYKHHYLNYEESLRRGLTPKGFRIRKYPAFEPVSHDAQMKWNEILYNSKKNLVELLLNESSNVAAKLEIDLNNKLLNLHPNDQKEQGIHLSKNTRVRKGKRIRKRKIIKMEKDRGETTRKSYQ